MKISEQWLREFSGLRFTSEELAKRLTLAGIEIGAAEAVAPAITGVFTGKILAVTPHPQADRLRVCAVDAGKLGRHDVVCGAANAAPELTVPFAMPGAVLPGGKSIQAAEIRGVKSAGMLCSASELGLEEQSSGLLVLDAGTPLGQPIGKVLGLDDRQVEVELTPNRGDCLSIRGLARELSALTGKTAKPAAIKLAKVASRARREVKLEAPADAARYTGRVIEDINPAATTPVWMRERLRRAGLRSIHPVVDVTNYVMLEIGQPLHAFDLSALDGTIRARHAKKGETLALLDGRTLTLATVDLVIADGRRALALAGVMGGSDSSVTTATTSIFLESAWFRPETISVRARAHGLHTDSSHRFERGVDPVMTREALERATALIIEIAGGRAGAVSEAASARHLPRIRPVTLRAARINRLLGFAPQVKAIENILKSLGMKIARSGRGSEMRWRVTPPSWRFDVRIEPDLIEEIARVHGYDRIPFHAPAASLAVSLPSGTRTPLPQLRDLLIARGYREAITYSFVDPTLQEKLFPGVETRTLANPISADMAAMRVSLWPGLLQAMRHNLNRQLSGVRLFEIGNRYLVEGESVRETRMLSGLLTGPVMPEQWGAATRSADFFDLKGDVEGLLAVGGQAAGYRFTAATHPALHPGQSARVERNGKTVGWVGALHPAIQAGLDITSTVYLFEFEVDVVMDGGLPKYREISRFPAVRRDLAVVIDEKLAAQAIQDEICAISGNLLTHLQLFDEYRGEGIDSGRKSLALGLTFQDTSRTLNEVDIEQVIARVVSGLENRFGAKLRK